MPKNDELVRIVLLLLLFGIIPKLSTAQDSDLRPVTSSYALKSVTIVQAPGRTIEGGTVVIENGIIKSVGKNISIPASAWQIDADSMYVYAGFISGMSTIGAEKMEEKERKDDRKLTGTPSYERAGITPNLNVRTTLSAKEKSISAYRKLGFTASHTVPYGGMISGTGAIILMNGTSKEDLLFKENVSMFSQWKGANGVYPNTVIGIMAKYRDMYRKANQARDYASKYASSSNGMERPDSDEMIEALFPVVAKQIPVAFKAENLLDITRALTLKNDLGFDIILGEVRQAWDIIPQIKSANASVFLSFDLPEMKEEKEKKEETEEDEDDADDPTSEDLEREALEKRKNEMILNYYTQPATLAAKGVKFGFSSFDGKSKDFKENMMKLIENGLSEDNLLAALTTNPAEILGVSSMMGTVDNGKIANLIVTDKPYFEKKSNVRFVFVDGVKYEFETKAKKKKSSGEGTAEIKGKWNYTVESPQGDGTGIVTIMGEEGAYEGTISVSYNDSTNELREIVLDGNTLTFSFTINMGQDTTVDVSMEIDGDTFEGTLSVAEAGSFPIEGSKEPEN